MAKTAPIYCVTVQEFRRSLQVPLGYSPGVCKAPVPSGGSRGEPASSHLPACRGAHIPWLMAPSSNSDGWVLGTLDHPDLLFHFFRTGDYTGLLGCYGWNVVSLAKPYIEVLTPDGIAVGSGAFGKWLGLDEGMRPWMAPMIGSLSL